MILDILENSHHYTKLHSGFSKAFEFLMTPDIKSLAPQKYEIDGEHIFAIISKNTGRKKEDALLEVHKKYIDIQFILSGVDHIGWKPKSLCKQPSIDYSLQKDVQLFMDSPDIWLTCQNNVFVIFFPEDAHMPMISDSDIHKVVIKIAVT